jgi:hypothetical protein
MVSLEQNVQYLVTQNTIISVGIMNFEESIVTRSRKRSLDTFHFAKLSGDRTIPNNTSILTLWSNQADGKHQKAV